MEYRGVIRPGWEKPGNSEPDSLTRDIDHPSHVDKSELTSPKPASDCMSYALKVKSESLGIPQKMHLKVDVESGKLIVKKSKDGSEDKFYSHKKSKPPTPTLQHTPHVLVPV